MKSSLKKSLYLGLAAVSFAAVSGATTANASAAAKVTSDTTMTTPATSRNLNLTGSNAIYTKPGTVKGSKLVATTTTAKNVNTSKHGADNFRAYRVAVTDRGSVYYKVVSFDGHYRGYVYGGKKVNSFSGGVTAYNTTKSATAPSSTASYTLTAGTNSSANTLFYAQPAWSQYKIGRASVNGKVLAATDAYKGASFTFDQAVTTSREGDLWYRISDTTLANGTKTNELNGAWVKASNVANLKADPAATSNNSVKVVYQTSNGNTVGDSKTFVTNSTHTQSGDSVFSGDQNNAGQNLDAFVKANVPAGYVYSSTGSATYGGTVYVTVGQQAASKASLAQKDSNNYITDLSASDLANQPTMITSDQQKAFSGNAGDPFNGYATLTSAFGTTKYYAKGTTTVDGKTTYTYYTYDDAATRAQNSGLKYGDSIKLVFAKNTTTTAPENPTTPESSNTDYLN